MNSYSKRGVALRVSPVTCAVVLCLCGTAGATPLFLQGNPVVASPEWWTQPSYEVRRFAVGRSSTDLDTLDPGFGRLTKGVWEDFHSVADGEFTGTMRLEGRVPPRHGWAGGQYSIDYPLSKGAIVPVGKKLWEVADGSLGGVRLVRPGRSWDVKTEPAGRPWLTGLPSSRLPPPPTKEILIPLGGTLRLLGGSVECLGIAEGERPTDGSRERRVPAATLKIARPNGEDADPSAIEEVSFCVAEQFAYGGEPSVSLRVARIVPPDADRGVVGWVGFVDVRTPAADPAVGDTPDSAPSSTTADAAEEKEARGRKYYTNLYDRSAEVLGQRRELIEDLKTVLQYDGRKDDRWARERVELAIKTLGSLRAVEAVRPLTWFLDFRPDPHPYGIRIGVGHLQRDTPDRRFPALAALVEIGLPAAEFCVKELPSERSEGRRRKLYWVITEVLGQKAGRQRLVDYAEEHRGGVQYRIERFLLGYDESVPAQNGESPSEPGSLLDGTPIFQRPPDAPRPALPEPLVHPPHDGAGVDLKE